MQRVYLMLPQIMLFQKKKFGYLILKKKLNFKYLKKSKISDRKDLEKRPRFMILSNKKIKNFLNIKNINLVRL